MAEVEEPKRPAMARWMARRMAVEAGPRDGEFAAFEEVAFRDRPGGSVAAAPVAVEHAPRPGFGALRRDGVEVALAVKTLSAHIQNRLQISYPLTVNLANHPPDELGRLVDIAALAALSDGAEGRRAPSLAALAGLNAPREAFEVFEARVADPPPFHAALAAVAAAGLGAHAYAVAIAVLPRPQPAEQAFLAYLAARLRLGSETVEGLRRRYRR